MTSILYSKAFPLAVGLLTGLAGSAWAESTYLKASNTGLEDMFGHSVAISGDTLIVGAWLEDSSATGVNGNENSNDAIDSGAAYVFVRDGLTWRQQAYLKASNAQAGDQFGVAVAIDGDTAIVGAWSEASGANVINGDGGDNSAPNAGAAYVFVRNGDTWTQQAYLKAGNAGANDRFGSAVGISGNTILVGAFQEAGNGTGVDADGANNDAAMSGAAYVFERNGTVWSQQAYLKASNTGAGDWFGYGVAISGDTAVIGAPFEDSGAVGINNDQNNNDATNAGAVYVFARNAGVWTQQAYLKASNSGAEDQFGESVAIDGNTMVVGASFEDSNADKSNATGAQNSGAAYVFSREGANWTEAALLKAGNAEEFDFFGGRVGISAERVVVGAVFEDSTATGMDGNSSDNSATWSGAAYLFELNESQWTQRHYLKASNTGSGDRFGSAVAINGNSLAVGAHWEASSAAGVGGIESDDSLLRSGAVYWFDLTPRLVPISSWVMTGTGLRFTIPVAPGQMIGVEYAESLTGSQWLDLGDVEVNNGVGVFLESEPARAGKATGFYRAFLR